MDQNRVSHRRRTAFFGGTFDPPHLGHLAEAETALRTGATDRVLFVPAFAPPHKSGRPITPFTQRLEMLRLALDGRDGMEISTAERELAAEPSYTILVMEYLEAHRPDDRLQLLIGGDSLAYLHRWHRGTELARRWEVLTYPRREETPDLAFLLRYWPPELAEKLRAGILDGPFFEISSTEIRKKMENGENPATVIPEKVLDYLKRNRIYSGQPEGGTKR